MAFWTNSRAQNVKNHIYYKTPLILSGNTKQTLTWNLNQNLTGWINLNLSWTTLTIDYTVKNYLNKPFLKQIFIFEWAVLGFIILFIGLIKIIKND